MPLTRKRKPSPSMRRPTARNAQKSTGPRTPRGKQRVRLNALMQGLRSDSFSEPMAKNVATGLALPALGRAIGAVSGKPHPYIAPTAVRGARTTTARAPPKRLRVSNLEVGYWLTVPRLQGECRCPLLE
jgi:hypothetical protein